MNESLDFVVVVELLSESGSLLLEFSNLLFVLTNFMSDLTSDVVCGVELFDVVGNGLY